jgi:hypothetical protein
VAKNRTGYTFRVGNKWYARITYTDDQGVRHNAKRTANSEKDARLKLSELVAHFGGAGKKRNKNSERQKRLILPHEEQLVLHVFKKYSRRAAERQLQFNLTLDDVKKHIHAPCYFCGTQYTNSFDIRGRTMYYNGIDRIDNSIGYERDNCQPCCWRCNYAKRDSSVEDFANWANKLVKNFPTLLQDTVTPL